MNNLFKFNNYIFQDVKWHYQRNNILMMLGRYLVDTSFKFCLLLRFSQQYKWGGVFYRRFCCRMNISVPQNIKMGEGVFFPHGFPLVINGKAIIGRFVIIHPNVLIGGDRKTMMSPIIGDYCYIGNGVKIIGNVKIGKWCFIAPGSVVTKDIPDGSVVGFGLNNIISNNGQKRVWEYLSENIKIDYQNNERNN